MSNELDFIKVYQTDVNDSKSKKGQFDYLPWADAWAEFMKFYPNATYEIKKFANKDGVLLPYMVDTTGYMINTTVTVNKLTHEMWLPVMDFKNKAIVNANMMDINKTIMRCLTKNLAMFGLGLYIFQGEDLPEMDYEVIIENATTVERLTEIHNTMNKSEKDEFLELLKQRKAILIEMENK